MEHVISRATSIRNIQGRALAPSHVHSMGVLNLQRLEGWWDRGLGKGLIHAFMTFYIYSRWRCGYYDNTYFLTGKIIKSQLGKRLV